jgi:hypothetical protein
MSRGVMARTIALAILAWAGVSAAREGPNPAGRLVLPLDGVAPATPPATATRLRVTAPAATQAVPAPLAAGAVALDSTWYDIQDMGSLGPRIVVGADGRVHVTWQDDFCEFDANGCPPNLNLPQPHPLRGMGYAWRDVASTWHHLGKVEDPAIRVCPCVSEVFGGFGAIAVAPDGRAVVAQHMNEDGCDLRGDFYLQDAVGAADWAAYLTPITEPSYLFPSVAVTPGGSFIVLSEIPKAAYYDETETFRISRVAAAGTAFVCPTGWQGGPWTQVIASSFFRDGFPAFPSIAASSNGRVGVAVGDFGGNVYLVESSNGTFTAGTITIRNLTNYSDASVTATDSTSTQFRPYVSCHLAYNDTTPHVVWSELQARRSGSSVVYFDHRSRIRHWSSVTGASTVTQVQAGQADRFDDIDQGLSGPLCGFNTISVDWPQVGFSADGSEAYVVWLRFSDAEIDPTGNMGLPGVITGIGFADIAASLRVGAGPWGPPQNLTSTPSTDERFVSIAQRNPAGQAHLLYQSSATNEAGVAAIGDRGGSPGNLLRRIAYLQRQLDGTTVSVAQEWTPAAPALRAYPNPARGAVRFTATSPLRDGEIRVYSADGRIVARVPLRGAAASWDGRDAKGRRAAAGLYFARIDGEPANRGTKFLLVH